MFQHDCLDTCCFECLTYMCFVFLYLPLFSAVEHVSRGKALYTYYYYNDYDDDDNDSNNYNDDNSIERRNSRFFTICSLCRELSPRRTLKWPVSNRVQITCNTPSAYHVQHVVYHVVRRDSSAIKFDRVEIEFIFALFYRLNEWPMKYGELDRTHSSNRSKGETEVGAATLLGNLRPALSDILVGGIHKRCEGRGRPWCTWRRFTEA